VQHREVRLHARISAELCERGCVDLAEGARDARELAGRDRFLRSDPSEATRVARIASPRPSTETIAASRSPSMLVPVIVPATSRGLPVG
jgi:hypothetical protein